ncbi:hypothetical protein DFH09DRAFT_1341883 [Mycena vulgaris]|nr:hypothetical protein DFH09DRAFT_1341883 [Mycena vulgaris]
MCVRYFTATHSNLASRFQDGTLTDSISAVEAAWGKVVIDIGQDPVHVIAATHGKRAPIQQARRWLPSKLALNTPFDSPFTSGFATPALSAGSSAPSSRTSSMVQARRPSFATRLFSMLSLSAVSESPDVGIPDAYNAEFEDPLMEEDHDEIMGGETEKEKLQRHQFEAWQVEAQSVDRALRILPGVKCIMSSIPAGRYAVATSGAKHTPVAA